MFQADWCGDTMDAADKRMLEREALRNMIQQWNANRLDLFALSEPNEVTLVITIYTLSPLHKVLIAFCLAYWPYDLFM